MHRFTTFVVHDVFWGEFFKLITKRDPQASFRNVLMGSKFPKFWTLKRSIYDQYKIPTVICINGLQPLIYAKNRFFMGSFRGDIFVGYEKT